jgi:hypothetical protein
MGPRSVTTSIGEGHALVIDDPAAGVPLALSGKVHAKVQADSSPDRGRRPHHLVGERSRCEGPGCRAFAGVDHQQGARPAAGRAGLIPILVSLH